MMKTKLFLPLFVALFFFGILHSASAALTDSLVSYWKLDESSDGSGAVAREDIHGTNDLTDNNTTASAAGKISNGADFERSNLEYLSISDAAQTSLDLTGDFAVSFWYKPESQPDTDTNHGWIAKWVSGNGQYRLMYQDSSGVKRLVVQLYDNDAPSTNVGYVKNQTLTNGVWYHLAFSFDVSTGTMTFYVNGSSIGTVVDTAVNQINDGSGTFILGSDYLTSDSTTDGIMDEVGIWSRELSGSEVTELYNGGTGLEYPFGSSTSITGSGTTNRIAKFTSGSTLGNSLLSDDGFHTILTSGNFYFQPGSVLDAATSGALSFGTATATDITLGRSGQIALVKSKLNVGSASATSSLEVFGLASSTSLFSGSGTLGSLLVSGSSVLQAFTGTNYLALGSTTLQNFTAVTGTTTNIFSTNGNITTLTMGTLKTSNNCASSASPAVCSSAPAGSVAMAIGGSTLVVNTTAVTANSQIMVQEDSSLGTRLGITCNTTTGRIYTISARTAGTSFTIKSSANPATNKACLSYWIVN